MRPWPAPSPCRGAGRAPSSRTSTSSARARSAAGPRARRAGVLEGVGQALLDDAVGAQVDARRQRHRARPRRPGRPAGRRARPARRAGRSARRRAAARAPRRRRRAAAPEQPARLGQRLAAGLLDRGERLARRRLLGAEGVALRAGLDDHHAHVVGDEVVQLAGDPRALVGHRLARAQVALALEQLRARGERLGPQLALADRAAGDEHRHDRTTVKCTPSADAAVRRQRAERVGAPRGRRSRSGSRACRSRRRARTGRRSSRSPARRRARARRRQQRGGRQRHDEAAASGSRRRTASGAVTTSISGRSRPSGPGSCCRPRPGPGPRPPARRRPGGRASPLGQAAHGQTLAPRGRAFHLPCGGSGGAEDQPRGRGQIARRPDETPLAAA